MRRGIGFGLIGGGAFRRLRPVPLLLVRRVMRWGNDVAALNLVFERIVVKGRILGTVIYPAKLAVLVRRLLPLYLRRLKD